LFVFCGVFVVAALAEEEEEEEEESGNQVIEDCKQVMDGFHVTHSNGQMPHQGHHFSS
jgi:hypothetical protein